MAKKQSWRKREPDEALEDLRDDCIAIVINSNLTFKQVHEQGGPTPGTVSKWLYRETKFPRLTTVRAVLNACGHDLTITPMGQEVHRYGHEGIEYPGHKAVLKTATRRKR